MACPLAARSAHRVRGCRRAGTAVACVRIPEQHSRRSRRPCTPRTRSSERRLSAALATRLGWGLTGGTLLSERLSLLQQLRCGGATPRTPLLRVNRVSLVWPALMCVPIPRCQELEECTSGDLHRRKGGAVAFSRDRGRGESDGHDREGDVVVVPLPVKEWTGYLPD